MKNLLLLPALFLLACGYQPGFDSEGGQVHFHDPGLWTGLGLLGDVFANEGPLVAGTRFCPTLTPTTRERERPNGSTEQVELPADYLDCFDLTVLGPVELDGQCFVLEGAGQLHWDIAAQSCSWTGDPDFAPVDDQVTVEIAGPDELQASLQAAAEEVAEELFLPGPDGWPEDARPGPDARIGVVAGAQVGFPVVLETAAGDRAAFAWGGLLEGDEPALDATGGWLRVNNLSGDLPEIVHEDDGQVALIPSPDSETVLSLELDGHSWTAATLETVTEAASLELVVAWSGAPAAARAVIRTDDGMLVYGAPVQWTVTGPLLLEDPQESWGDAWFPGADYTLFQLDEAQLPLSEDPFPVSATLTASWAGLSQTVELEWLQAPTAEAEPEDWEEDDWGDEVRPIDCSCDLPGPPPLLPFMLLLPALPVLRRGRW